VTSPETDDQPPRADRRWPRQVYGRGSEPDPRFTFANERTFLAWIRTCLGLLTAGVAIAALADLQPRLTIEAHFASLILILAGIGSAISAFLRWARNERAIRENRPLPSSVLMPLMAGGLGAVGVIALFILLP
jgi:putative membrane protein